jgi:rfaE bifunctional protein nucleotidyltransferase chain/domain
MQTKVKELYDLKQIIDREKKAGKKIVFANGCFDVLHVGHVRYLNEAKSLGDVLVVGLNSDSSVRKIKGDRRPVLDQHARATILSALQCVDHILIFDDDTVDRLLMELKPNLHCKGSDYTPDTIPERDTVKQYGGEKVQSTRWLFEEIKRRFAK